MNCRCSLFSLRTLASPDLMTGVLMTGISFFLKFILQGKSGSARGGPIYAVHNDEM